MQGEQKKGPFIVFRVVFLGQHNLIQTLKPFPCIPPQLNQNCRKELPSQNLITFCISRLVPGGYYRSCNVRHYIYLQWYICNRLLAMVYL